MVHCVFVGRYVWKVSIDSVVLLMNPAAARVSKGEVMMVATFMVVEDKRT